MLRTRFTELFGLDYPVMSAPMAMHSGATLAAAVSAAGALGSFGGVNPKGPDWISEQAAAIRAETDRPFAIGFITAFIDIACVAFVFNARYIFSFIVKIVWHNRIDSFYL